MKIAVVTRLFTKWDMNIDSGDGYSNLNSIITWNFKIPELIFNMAFKKKSITF